MAERDKPRSTKAVDDAYERGYRRGRTEATAAARKFYADRIREAVTILQAPIPLSAEDA